MDGVFMDDAFRLLDMGERGWKKGGKGERNSRDVGGVIISFDWLNI